jgi:hypothetical protein
VLNLFLVFVILLLIILALKFTTIIGCLFLYEPIFGSCELLVFFLRRFGSFFFSIPIQVSLYFFVIITEHIIVSLF